MKQRQAAVRVFLAVSLVFAIPVAATSPVITSVRESGDEEALIIRGAGFGRPAGEVFLGNKELTVISWNKKRVKSSRPQGLKPGTYLLTLRTASEELFLMDLTVGSVGQQGPPGPPGEGGPQGEPGVAGVSLSFYLVEGPTKMVPSLVTDTETLSCRSGDAVTGWAMEGAGIIATTAPVSAGIRSVIPVVTGTVPTGFTFHYACRTTPTCEITNRIICADLAP